MAFVTMLMVTGRYTQMTKEDAVTARKASAAQSAPSAVCICALLQSETATCTTMCQDSDIIITVTTTVLLYYDLASSNYDRFTYTL